MSKLRAAHAVLLTFTAGPALAQTSGWQVRILTRGAPAKATNGLAVGPDGQHYIGSVLSRQIVVMARQTGAIVDRLERNIGVETPDDLAFGPDGSLYWTPVAPSVLCSAIYFICHDTWRNKVSAAT